MLEASKQASNADRPVFKKNSNRIESEQLKRMEDNDLASVDISLYWGRKVPFFLTLSFSTVINHLKQILNYPRRISRKTSGRPKKGS